MNNQAVGLIAVLALAGSVGGGFTNAQAEEVKPGQQQGLGLTGSSIPDVLVRAKADPYALPSPAGCATIAAELTALDEVLGPDADQPQVKKTDNGSAAVGGVVRSFIPYRGVVRFLTGADKKDKALVDAAMAGSTRRGYLRGLAITQNCHGPSDIDANAQAIPASDTAPALAAMPVNTAPPQPAVAPAAIPVADTPAQAPTMVRQTRVIGPGGSSTVTTDSSIAPAQGQMQMISENSSR